MKWKSFESFELAVISSDSISFLGGFSKSSNSSTVGYSLESPSLQEIVNWQVSSRLDSNSLNCLMLSTPKTKARLRSDDYDTLMDITCGDKLRANFSCLQVRSFNHVAWNNGQYKQSNPSNRRFQKPDDE